MKSGCAIPFQMTKLFADASWSNALFITFCFYRPFYVLPVFLLRKWCYSKTCHLPEDYSAYFVWLEIELKMNSMAQDAETIFWEVYQGQGTLYSKINLRKPSLQKSCMVLLQKCSHQANEQIRLLDIKLLSMIYCSTLFLRFECCF